MADKKNADSQLKKDHTEKGAELHSDKMEKSQGNKKKDTNVKE